jgi:gas vesicle protein
MGTLTGFVVGYLVGAQTGPESWKKLKDAAKQLADSEQAKALRESAEQMLHSAFQARGDGRPDWRVIASPELLNGLVSRGQALVSGLLERVPPAESNGSRPR